MAIESVNIPVEEYTLLKRTAELADDLVLQLQNSLKDIKEGKLKKF